VPVVTQTLRTASIAFALAGSELRRMYVVVKMFEWDQTID